jgi:hypothetical protein
MIWEARPATPQKTLADAILALCASAGVLESGGELKDMAAGVACRAEELAVPPVRRGDLSRLTARALGSLGRPEAARRVLVMGSGLVRSTRWLAAQPVPVWTLDLPRLLRRESDQLELALYPALASILDAMAGLWDGASGSGRLGLRGPGAAARLVLGPAARGERRLAFRRELRGFCETRLEAIGAGRGWTDRPDVLFIDPLTP